MSLILRQPLGRKLTIEEMDGNFTYLDEKTTFEITTDYKLNLIETNSNLFFIENIFGTSANGSQMLDIDLVNDQVSLQFITSMDPNFGKPMALSMIIGTYGSSQCVQVWDDNHDRWRSSISSESFLHSVRAFIATEADNDPLLTRSELETYDGITQEKSNIKIYKENVELAHWASGGTNSTVIKIQDSLIQIGTVYGANTTTLNIDADITINSQTTYSGTYSADGQIVTVINGLITSVS